MRLSWNEIRARADPFAAIWANDRYKKGDIQTFDNEFFELFTVRRRYVARFEKNVQKLDNSAYFIDLFWPGVLRIEQNSSGRNLVKAFGQAGDYFDVLKRARPTALYSATQFPDFRTGRTGRSARRLRSSVEGLTVERLMTAITTFALQGLDNRPGA